MLTENILDLVWKKLGFDARRLPADLTVAVKAGQLVQLVRDAYILAVEKCGEFVEKQGGIDEEVPY